ncbi:hypothetical protein CY34DRAFT_812732 [Suillus luteus UH-Slu-Lm8-n1]|uniref:Uncharacterized protein n=1 Tax=Suillus luteus UH-Slu-Lm8-n1 TaxID=930992 RepID=A0A0C9ZB05_9AGAM|nr:hypothetical protein CY34DRAFT_812732 [Suillus luteus UH-Slu-Lm8-n1]
MQPPTPKKEDVPSEDGFINRCFSFTIRRDKWGIPSMIIGNFIQVLTGMLEVGDSSMLDSPSVRGSLPADACSRK